MSPSAEELVMPPISRRPSAVLQPQKKAPENSPIGGMHKFMRFLMVIASAALLVFAFWPQPKTENMPGVQNSDLKAFEIGILPAGQLPDGFPKDLILSSDAEIFQSEDSLDGLGMPVKTVSYFSAAAPSEILNSYEAGLTAKSWNLSNKVEDPAASLLEFYKQDALRVIVTSAERGSQVKLEYHPFEEQK